MIHIKKTEGYSHRGFSPEFNIGLNIHTSLEPDKAITGCSET